MTLSASEQFTIDIVEKVLRGKISRKTGIQLLKISERTLRRYLEEFEKKGVLFVKHGNSGKRPVNKTPEDIKVKIKELVEDLYFDFNRTHAREKLSAHHHIKIKKDCFARICDELNILQKNKHRRKKGKKMRRERAESKGLLVQMDGSYHKWFGNSKSCFIGIIDDADGEVIYGQFTRWETTLACMEALKRVIEERGLFKILYVDKAGLFGGGKRAGFSHVKRALEELGIEIIFAHCPEGKGRIERLFKTLQDRLIPELRLNKIKTIQEANEFLNNYYLQEGHNKKFQKKLDEGKTAFQGLSPLVNLEEIFCIRLNRKVRKDNSFSYNGKFCDLNEELPCLAGKTIELRFYPNGKLKIMYNKTEIGLKREMEEAS